MLKGGVGLHPHGEAREHVRPIGKPGDLAKPLGLTLGAEPAAGHIKPLQSGIGGGIDLHLRFQNEGVRYAGNRQPFSVDAVLCRRQHPPVHGH